MPRFSVIIPSVNGLPFIDECLKALHKCRDDFGVEIVVVDATEDRTEEYVKERFPDLKFIRLSSRPGIPEMRFIGMSAASGDCFVFIEDHCIVPEDWFVEIEKAHSRGYAVVGGAVENGSTARLIDWAVFLCEYSSFMPPITAREAESLAGNNVSYERAVIDQIDEATKRDFWEYFMQAELRRNNVKFLSTPSITLVHKKEFGFFYFLRQRFYYSRSFAAMRRRRSTYLQQFLYIVSSPLAPFFLIWRVFENVLRRKRYLRELLLSSPFLLVFMFSYAIGELTGQLLGAGESLAKVE